MNIGTINPGSTQNRPANCSSRRPASVHNRPYKTSGEVQVALVRDDTRSGSNPTPRSRAPSTTSRSGHRDRRDARRSLPNIPTVNETGLEYEVVGWNAIFAPAGTPKDIVAKLNGEIVAIMAMPDIRKRMLELGTEPKASTPEEIAARLKADIDKWAAVIKQAGIEKR